MLDIQQAIVVEGRYDANKLRQIVNAPVFETAGFGVMNDKKLLSLLRRVAEKRGLIILTDPDGAGFVIRNFLRGALPKDRVLHAYVPDIYGKERRKEKPGKEGKLGVEGMDEATILRALRNAGVQASDSGAGSAGTHERQRSAAGPERTLRPRGIPENLFQHRRLK